MATTPMAADAGKMLDVDGVLSLADDLVAALRGSDDADAFAQVAAGVRMLRSACRSESDDLELQLGGYQGKIRSCKEKIEKVKAETIADEGLNALQMEMEEKLQEEKQLHQDLRVVRDELDNLDHQRASVEETKNVIKKEKDMRKAQNMLSMCVSVTNIIPNLEDQDKISGYIVDKNGEKIEKFEFEKTTSPVEICNELWKKV